jgi:integrase/recombinase XerD
MTLPNPRKHRKKRQGRPMREKLTVEHRGLYSYLARYLEWHTVKGFSEHTRLRKDSSLRRFILWCDERDLNDPSAITKPILERYQRHLFYYRRDNGEPLAFSSQHVMLAAVKDWFKWLTRENYIPSNPASEVLPIKRPRKLPDPVLSLEEIHIILNSINTKDAEGLRNRAVIELLYSTGVRRTELCRLLLSDLQLERSSLYVREGKGGKDRYIPIGQRTLDWVQKYLHQARPQLMTQHNEYHLFLNQYGEAMTTSYIGHMVKKILNEAGIKREGGCHLFRHAMATHMLENGAELRYIQAMLGHSNINTATVYTHIAIDKLRWVHETSHPASCENKDKPASGLEEK